MYINGLVADRGLTEMRVTQLLGLPQPHASELKHYKLNRFSSEELLRSATLLDRDSAVR
jgi:predicted XRE-type DNA-binding protein